MQSDIVVSWTLISNQFSLSRLSIVIIAALFVFLVEGFGHSCDCSRTLFGLWRSCLLLLLLLLLLLPLSILTRHLDFIQYLNDLKVAFLLVFPEKRLEFRLLPVFDRMEKFICEWLHTLLLDSTSAFDEAGTPWSVRPSYLIGCVDGHSSEKRWFLRK